MDKSVMNDLLNKYLDNKLTGSEFDEFRRYINASADEDLEDLLSRAWKEEQGVRADAGDIRNLKLIIDKSNHGDLTIKRHRIKRFMRSAAAIAIPLLLLAGYLLLGHSGNEDMMVVSAGKGNKAEMVLPDGSKVSINAQTTLSYNISDFNRKERVVTLSGEGYFAVAKNEKRPFIIKTDDCEVKVLGTEFNLKARDENNTVELDLLEGKVSLTSTLSNKEVIVMPDERAVLDKKSGTINVVRSDPSLSTAWLRGELVFHGATLRQVFGEIERSYGVTIRENFADSIMNDLFTGTFTLQNLDETLKILRMHYHFDYSIEGLEVTVQKSDNDKKL